MTTSDMIRQVCRESHVSLSELARRIGQSPQNFSKKLQRETLTLEELNLIGEALRISFEQSFVFSSGRRISTGVVKSDAPLSDSIGGITAFPYDHPLRKALTGDYNMVIYVDGPTGHCTFYALPEEVRNCFGKILDRNPGIGIVSSLLIENYVAPEDRHCLSTVLEMRNLMGAFRHTPNVSKIFRCVHENTEKYYELRVVKIGDDEKVQGAVIGVLDRDEMIREKVKSDALNSRLLSVTDSLASACSFVVSVNMKSDSAWICRTSMFIRETYGNIEWTEVPFRNVVLPIFFKDVHPDDLERIKDALQADTVRLSLTGAHDYSEHFRYNFNDRYYYAEMRVSRYGDGSDPDSFVLSFLNRDHDVRAAHDRRDELIDAVVAEVPENERQTVLERIRTKFSD